MNSSKPGIADPGETQVTRIVAMTDDGRGVADRPGKKLLVDGAITGELVSFTPMRRRRNHDQARVLEVIEPAAQRVAPHCEYFGRCGGCVLQHLSKTAQIEFKQKILLDRFREAGLASPRLLLPPLQAAEWQYRRRARLAVKFVAKKNRALVGFRERFHPYVTEMGHCETLAPLVSGMPASLSELVTGLDIRARLPQIEVAIGDDHSALVFRVLDPPSGRDIEALESFASLHQIDLYLQPGGLDSVVPLSSGLTRSLAYRLPDFDLDIAFSPLDFIQVNAAVNRSMVGQAVELMAPAPDSAVLDLYCGVGNFSLALARRGARVTGVEGDPGLVSRARQNAVRNHLDGVEYHSADLDAPVDNAAWWGGRYAAVLLDPPRAGAAAMVDVMPRWDPQRIVYVSCNPTTLARDAAVLVQQHGYVLDRLGVMDMFPHTAHMEAIALFTKG